MTKISLLPLSAMIAIAGCANTQASDMLLSSLDLPPAYETSVTSDAGLPATALWWSSFGDEALNGLVDTALARNKTLEAGLANVASARAALRVAESSALPSVSAGTNISTDSDSDFSNFSRSARLSASYQLDLFGSVAASRDAAGASLDSAEFAQRALELSVASDLAANYFDLQVARKQLEVAKENLEIAERIFEIVQVRYDAGDISGFDLASQEATLASSRAQIPQIEQQILSLRMAIAILLGQAPQQFEVATVDLYETDLPVPESGLPSELLVRRPDLLQAEADLRAGHANVQVARAAMLPSVDLGAGLTTLLTSLSDPTASLSAALAQTIFSGGALEAQLDSAMARREALVANYQQAILTALHEVDVALSAISTSAQREAHLEVALAASRKALDSAELRYRVGTDDLTSLLSAQQTYYSATQSALEARRDRLAAAIDLYVAMGGGF
jgi:outer membrane protein, multidrug efflux system